MTSRFKKDLSQLAKRYRSIRKDLEPLVEQLKSGEILGDQISGLNSQVQLIEVLRDTIDRTRKIGKSRAIPAYSLDFREKIVRAYEAGNTSIRKVAKRFMVTKRTVQRLIELLGNKSKAQYLFRSFHLFSSSI